jgi:acetyl esterase/lipase
LKSFRSSFRSSPKFFEVSLVADLVYSHAGGKPRFADLYLPKTPQQKVPIVVWLHGGGWRFGDRRMAPDLSRFFAERGFAMVSIDYRLSEEAVFPAPIEDVKTAVRWIRSVADTFGLDGNHIGLWGSSAGGHLAACAALSPAEQFQGSEHPGLSSAVQAVVDGYGPVDFSLIDKERDQFTPAAVDVEGIVVPDLLPAGHPESFESRFLGVPVDSSPEQVKLANPITYVHRGAPPFLILHGLSDRLIPWPQSRLLFEALQAAENEATMLTFERLGHGFFNNSKLDFVDPGSVTMFRTAASKAFECGARADKIGFGFDFVEDFLRTHLFRS